MASNNGGRKRQQKSKTGLQHKVSQSDKQRDHSSQQPRQQLNEPQNKHPHDHHGQQHQTQQQQQQQQQKQQQQQQQQKQKQQQQLQQRKQQQQQQQRQLHNSTATLTKTVLQSGVSESPIQSLMSKTVVVGRGDQDKFNVTLQDGNTSLHTAVCWRRHDIVEALLKKGAKPWETDQQGNTAFIAACRVGDTKLMLTIWDAAGSNLDIQHANKEGNTALHFCAVSGHEEGCHFLLSRNAGVQTKNKLGETPLHLAAKGDHVSVCHTLLNFIMLSARDTLDMHSCILEENGKEQSAICVSIMHQHAQVTRMLLDFLTAQQQATYLTSKIRKVVNQPQPVNYSNSESTDQGCQEVFLHGLLVSLSVLLIRLAERRRLEKSLSDQASASKNDVRLDHCLTSTDVIQLFVRIACNRHDNQQIIVPIACFLLIYLMEGVPERAVVHIAGNNLTSEMCFDNENISSASSKILHTGMTFLGQFIQCRGPDNLLLKLKETDVTDPNNAMVTIATAAPIVSLVRSVAGRTWLESNKCHLTFLKELLLRNRSTLALLTSTCPLLHPSFLESICQEFVRLVEMLEDRDREKNLAELLWEEERDRMRRERKKQKRQQKKQQASKELKRDVSLLSMQMIEMSSEDETGMSLTDKMTATEDTRTEMWKNNKPLQSEDDDVFGENSTSSKKYRVQDATTHGIACILSRDELTLVRCEDESKKSQCDQKMKSNDFPTITTDKTAERIENTKMEKEDEKKGNGGTQTKEPMAYGNFQSECSGAVPNVKRWADVAKLGCNPADRGLQGQEEMDSQSRMSSDKVSFCDWPRTGSLKNADMFKAVKDTGMANAQKQEVVDLTMIDTEWYDVINPCSAMDINSDEDSSSSSSSSFGSRSSLVSDSCLHIRKQNWLSEKVHIDVKLEDDEACKEKAADLSTCSPLLSRKKRRKSKTSQSCEQAKSFALYATDTCWDPSCHLSKGQSSMPLLTEEDKIKVTFKIPGVGAPLLRTQSDDVLNDSSSSEDVKKCYGLKADSTFKTSIKNNPLWNQMTASTFKIETPTALPPLKVREIDINRAGVGDSFLVDSGAVENKGEAKGESTEMRKFVWNTTCGKQSFRGRNAPLARIKTGASLFNSHRTDANAHAYGNVQDASSSRNNIIPWSDLSTLIVPTSTLPQRPLSISPLPGQDVLYAHPPPPGFQTLKSTMSGQAITDTQGCNKTIATDIKNHEIRHKMAAATSTKGRVITTILLDKVKNPPISFKQNKVPSLSTLAWHCGEESNQVWSKLLHSKIATTVPASVFESDTVRSTLRSSRGDYVLDTPFSKPSSEITTLSTPSEHDRAGQYGIVRPSNLCLPFPCSSIPVFSSFSTILMNRMQQRRHNRNSSSSMSMAGDITSNKSNHGAEVCTKEQKSRPSRTAPGASVTLDSSSLSSVQSRNHPSISQQHTHIQQLRQHQLSSKPTILVETHQSDAVEMVKIQKGSLTAVTREIGNRNTEGRYTVSNSQCQENQRRSSHHSDSRGTSPPVFFPEQIRDDVNTTAERGATFPAFHDVHTSDFLSEMFSDPLFSDKIAINQIRQKILSSQANQSQQSDFSVQATEGSDIDLDYYASLYQMKFRDVLGCLPGQNLPSSKSEREANLIGGQKAGTNATPKDGQGWNKNNQVFGVSSLPGNRGDVRLSRTHSPRWHTSLQKMLDLPWTMRRQYGNIVLPHCVPDFSIGMSGDVLLLLGFLIDGNEVAVLIMDTARSHILPRMVDVISDSEMDKHFLTRCKSFSESSNIQYMAIALYEYTLCEYLQLCLPGGNQNQSISTGLIWELLQALSFLHHGLGMPHGYLAPCWIFIDAEGHLRLAGFGITTTSPVVEDKNECNTTTNFQGYEYISPCMTTTDDLNNERAKPSFCNDTQAAGMLSYFILTKGQHLFGVASLETELSLMRDRVGTEAFDFISPMLASDPKSRPTIDQCLKHPMFWSGDKKFRLILIVGSDVLTEMKTGVALTGNGAPTMMEILSSEDINAVSPNWIHEVDGTVLKEMRSFRVYKNNLAELTLFVYNCCLHFDKLSNVAKEVLDDPCKYFQNLFPGLFIAIYRSLKSSDRTDRTCYKPFF